MVKINMSRLFFSLILITLRFFITVPELSYYFGTLINKNPRAALGAPRAALGAPRAVLGAPRAAQGRNISVPERGIRAEL